MRALVTGGYFDSGGDGVVWLVDLVEERADVVLRWAPPPELRVPNKGFAGGSVGPDGQLYVAAHAAVVRIDPHAGEISGVLHQPCMNDLHHVACLDDRLYVANTGLGAIDVLDLDGSFLGSHAVLPAWVNTRRLHGQDPPGGRFPMQPGWRGEAPGDWTSEAPEHDDYHTVARDQAPFHRQKVRDHLHLNHVCAVGSRRLVTCFADGTLRDLTTFAPVARFPGHFLHDGVLEDDTLWLTAIDGTLIALDACTLREVRRLQAFATGHHGWCRGLAVTPDHLVVGLTEVRADRLPRHRWADVDPTTSETSVLLLDRGDGRLLARVDLSDAARHSKLYSILPWEGP